MKPFAESSEQNKQPIYSVLENILPGVSSLLEIGSGTGQHAVFFAEKFPHVHWQCSDRQENIAGIQQWLDEAALPNLPEALSLDVNQPNWPVGEFEAVYSANTVHIMDWKSVESMFEGIGKVLKQSGLFMLYGPFNYNGEFTSESNARFDQWLKARDPESGVRDYESLDELAKFHKFEFQNDYEMPANNRILVWQKSGE